MIKKSSKYTAVFMAALFLFSCAQDEAPEEIAEFVLSISPEVQDSFDPDPIPNSRVSVNSKANLYNSISEIQDMPLVVYAWEDNKSYIEGDSLVYDAGSWSFSETYKVSKQHNYVYYSYANLSSGGVEPISCTKDSISLDVTDISVAQNDILLGCGSASAPESGDFDLTFTHPFASVKFTLSAVDYVKSVNEISLSGLIRSGHTKLSEGDAAYVWTNMGNADATVTETGLNVTQDSIATFTVIPQNLSEKNVVMAIKYTTTDDATGSMTKLINSGEWVAGHTTTYTLGHVDFVDVKISDGNVIVNNGQSRIYVRATITGAWYIGDDIVAPWNNTSEEGSFTGLPGTDWSASGNYFYYTKSVANGGSPTSLFTGYTPKTIVSGATLKLDVLVQAIPYDSNKTCREAFEAL